MAQYSPLQERTALGLRGVEGKLGETEVNYYKNLLQRSLIGEGNQFDPNQQNFLNPIEGQYFAQQGMPTDDLTSFLRAIRA
jgi:hypothetical protein